ncbi:MAG: tail fiber domain-containing protein [Verrucomicrobiota bacterium]
MKSPSIRPLTTASFALVLALGMAPPLHADQVILDDLIVIGNAGIGTDATDGMSFGFDTIILRENNLRMFFDDTSASASFPKNDWRILINDSAMGGDSYFAIEDATAVAVPFTIMAGAPNDALHIDSTGRIGLGTAIPAASLHILEESAPSVVFEQSNDTFPSYTWTVSADHTAFNIQDSITAVSPFSIGAGAPDNSLAIASDGSVGLGIDSPNAEMHVVVDTTMGEGMIVGPASVSSNNATLHVEGTAFIAQDFQIGSSRTRKEEIRELELAEARAALEELDPVQFRYKNDPETQLGFIAEDVPDLVATQERRSLAPMGFVAVITKVVQGYELRERRLRQQVTDQEAQLNELLERLEKLETRGDGAEKEVRP